MVEKTMLWSIRVVRGSSIAKRFERAYRRKTRQDQAKSYAVKDVVKRLDRGVGAGVSFTLTALTLA